MDLQQKLFTFFHDNRGLPFRSIAVFNWLLEAALMGSILILILVLARRFLRRKVGSRMILFCWLLVAARLLLPVALPNRAMNELRPTLSTDEAARPVADQIRVRVRDAMFDYGTLPMRQAEDTKDTGYSLRNIVFDLSCYTSYGWTGKWALIAYVSVSGALLLAFIAQNLRFRRQMRKNRVDSLYPEETARYEAICRRYGVQPVPVSYVDPLATPCVWGVLHPQIALPLTLRPEELDSVLAHEVCHLRAGDTRWALLRILCLAAHWFNPLVWLAARLSRLDAEMACDERVTSGMDPDERLRYAGTLVLSVARRGAPGLAVTASGMSMNGRQMKQRLRSIVACERIQRRVCTVFLLLAMLATFLSFGTAESYEESYDMALDKAQYNFLMDDPYGAGLPDTGAAPVGKRVISTEGDAIGYARDILVDGGLLPGLSFMPHVSHENGLWITAGSGDGFEGGSWVLCFADDGNVLGFNSVLPGQERRDYPFEVGQSITDHMTEVMNFFFRQVPADAPHASIEARGDQYTLETRFYRGQCLDADGNVTAQFEAPLGNAYTRLTYFLNLYALAGSGLQPLVTSALSGMDLPITVPDPAPTTPPFALIVRDGIALVAINDGAELPERLSKANVSAETALRAGIAAVQTQKGVTDEMLAACQLHYSITESDGSYRYWNMTLWHDEDHRWDVCIDAVTGKVVEVMDQDDGNG